MDTPAGSSFVPDSCTLPTAEQPLRVAEFQALFAASLREVRRASSTQLVLELDADPGVEHVTRDLAAREGQCCSFFTFSFTRGEASPGRSLEMSVSVPNVHVAVLDGVQRLASSSMSSPGPA
ncbi:hypothetical protein G1H11_21285 [Phytoactinopolyspora alkaliphila]|uniref:Uncharacterized protein n=1 Tax=Phytoactinopolyspora alkaliphila TaxID=1783498 RepID=A0A6N9YSC6_9ACTN|nr:hypothetical protein [Phytoactinopolyspora alkaliphila]NED97837.1 hypothetical protein [Phytoactinopolyspora alkaliphila]